MKKVLMTLLGLCVGITLGFAQTGENCPWTPNYQYEKVMLVLAVVDIDGVEQYDESFGVASFINGECRDTQTNAGEEDGHLLYVLAVSGDNGDMISFRLWNQETGEALNLDSDFTLVFDEEGAGFDEYVRIAFTTPAATGITKDITPWTVETTQGEQKANGWYLLASPVGTIDDATTVTNLLSNNYDLYAFDEAQNLEWLNYDGDEELEYAGHFSIEAGKGYLYANSGDGVSETVTLTFPGDANTNDVTISLAKTEGVVFEGWNLIGNPFNENYFMPDTHPFYVMNGDRTDVAIPNRNYLEPMEGAFIIATQDEESFVFSIASPGPTPGGGGGGIGGDEPEFAINLGNSHTIIDRAVVRIGENRSELPKFQLNPNHTKVFIPKEGKDYAVVSTGEMGEMPVNFKAEKSGTYTMNLSSENVKFSYLHLIDNLTGNDVDLLANPTYSFNAQTTDYASRFRLVFATDSSVNSDSFGFVNSSGNFCVYGIEGEATLQVYDVLGHMLSSETFSGSIEKKVNAATGVYMMRLINGNDVKVQKVIIK